MTSERADATGIYGHVKNFLDVCGIYTLPIVAQSYDGAAVMTGHVNGVQQKMHQDHPSVVYMHCMPHKLNLVLVDASKVNRTATMFFTPSRVFIHFSHNQANTMHGIYNKGP